MCSKCDQIDETISRYRRLKWQMNDQQLIEAVDSQLAQLDADKLALHPALLVTMSDRLSWRPLSF
jgi:hypothetical protein